MAADSNLVLQASVTKTSTFSGTAVDLKTGTPRRGLKARVIYGAAHNTSGANSVAWTIDHSDDNNTWYQLASGKEHDLALTSSAQAGEFHIPFETSKRYVRLTVTIADTGSGNTPTVTYQGDIVLGRPG